MQMELLKNPDPTDEEAGNPEQEAMFYTLTILENFIEARPETATMLTKETSLMRWILQRTSGENGPKVFDSVRGYCAELLSIIVQSDDSNRKVIGTDLKGVESCLMAINVQ